MHSSALQHSRRTQACIHLCWQELSITLSANWLAEWNNWKKNHFPTPVHAREQHNQTWLWVDSCHHNDQVHQPKLKKNVPRAKIPTKYTTRYFWRQSDVCLCVQPGNTSASVYMSNIAPRFAFLHDHRLTYQSTVMMHEKILNNTE